MVTPAQARYRSSWQAWPCLRGVGGAILRRHHEEGVRLRRYVAVLSALKSPQNLVVAQHRDVDDVSIWSRHVKARVSVKRRSREKVVANTVYQLCERVVQRSRSYMSATSYGQPLYKPLMSKR